jgi:hypothetical protein
LYHIKKGYQGEKKRKKKYQGRKEEMKYLKVGRKEGRKDGW